jgi:FtsH-binding integral membrane protein
MRDFLRKDDVRAMVTSTNNRRQFIIKVFSLLSLQFSFLASLVLASAVSSSFNQSLQQLGWEAFACGLLDVVLVVVVYFKPSLCREFPINYLILTAFVTLTQTALTTVCLAYISSQYPPEILLFAVLATAVDTYLMALYAAQSKYDFTLLGGLVVSVVVGLAMLLVFSLIYSGTWLGLLVSFAVLVAFNFYLVFDIQLVAGGRNKEFNYDDYVLAVLLLYIVSATQDIVLLFVYMLKTTVDAAAMCCHWPR